MNNEFIMAPYFQLIDPAIKPSIIINARYGDTFNDSRLLICQPEALSEIGF